VLLAMRPLACWDVTRPLNPRSPRRYDARKLVIRPLTRLLEIVFHYVRNPLSPDISRFNKNEEEATGVRSSICRVQEPADEQMEYFETEQVSPPTPPRPPP
jgi:hypothetical protein